MVWDATAAETNAKSVLNTSKMGMQLPAISEGTAVNKDAADKQVPSTGSVPVPGETGKNLNIKILFPRDFKALLLIKYRQIYLQNKNNNI